MTTILGHDFFGTGTSRAIVMNDWMCDTSTWDGARPYLDGKAVTWAFADLRGYGRSRSLTGDYTLAEAAGDVWALADFLGWEHFTLVGHSMSSLVALHLAQHPEGRIGRAVLLTPPPPRGFGVDDAVLARMQASIDDDEEHRVKNLRARFGDHYTDEWTRYKASRWMLTADTAAARAYISLFAQKGVPGPTTRVAIPVLAVCGERDAPPMRSEAVQAALGPLCDALIVAPVHDSGHYPMQECPPLTATLVSRFVAQARPKSVTPGPIS